MSLLRGIEDDDAPPSYIDSIVPASSAPAFPSSSSPASPGLLPPSLTESLTSSLTNHLRTLPARLNAAQYARATEQASLELDLITLLVPSIETFLNDLGNLPRIPPNAELTIVPQAAVPAGWVLSGAAERRKEGELVRVLKFNVSSELQDGGSKGEKGGHGQSSQRWAPNEDGDSNDTLSPSQEAGFDEWGRFDCEETDGTNTKDWAWFKDEGMARRLATYLRPEAKVERKHVQQIVIEQKKVEKTGIWGRWGKGKKKEEEESVMGATGLTGTVGPGPGAESKEDEIKMIVRAREVTFRKENEFGVWEGRTGFGIVVSVRVAAA